MTSFEELLEDRLDNIDLLTALFNMPSFDGRATIRAEVVSLINELKDIKAELKIANGVIETLKEGNND